MWRELGHLHQAATELASKKHRLARLGQDPKTQSDFESYRQRLTELGASHPNQLTNHLTSEPADHSGARTDGEEPA
jgi:hypothetical protein